MKRHTRQITQPHLTDLLVPIAIACALLTGCGEAPESSGEAVTPIVGAQPPAAAPAQVEFRIPPADFPADPAHGRELFNDHCLQCHGAEAQGTDQGPPLIHRIYEPSHHSDLAFYRAIALGVQQHHWEFGNMEPVPVLDGEDAAHIISWIRAEQRAAGIE